MAVLSMTLTYICFQMTLTYKIGVVLCHPVKEGNQLQQLLDDLSLRERNSANNHETVLGRTNRGIQHKRLYELYYSEIHSFSFTAYV